MEICLDAWGIKKLDLKNRNLSGVEIILDEVPKRRAGNPAFIKGVSGNPGGKTKIPTDIMEARKISQYEFERIVNHFLFMPAESIDKKLDRPGTTVFEKLIGTILQKALVGGDEKKAEWILARTLGKMREHLSVSSDARRLNVNISIPTTEQLQVENPNLSLPQLEALKDNLKKINGELVAKEDFIETVALPPKEAAALPPKEDPPVAAKLGHDKET